MTDSSQQSGHQQPASLRTADPVPSVTSAVEFVSNPVPQLQDNRLLASLSAQDLALLEPHLTLIRLSGGEALYQPGDLIDRVYFPCSGVVSMMLVMGNSATVETAALGRDGGIAVLAGIAERRALSRVLVQVPGDAFLIEAPRFRAAVRESDGLRDMIMHATQAVLAQVIQSVACNALHPVEARLCRWLLMCRDRTGSTTIPLTQEFMAAMLGVQRTTVTAVARSLQDVGLIRYRRGMIELLDLPGLQNASCECYEAVRHHYEIPRVSRPAEAADWAAVSGGAGVLGS